MRRALFDDYLGDPIGRFTTGDGWLHFCTADATLSGVIAWGEFRGEACRALLPCVVSALEKMPPHARLVDGRRGTGVEAISFRLVGDYVVRHREALRERISQVAIVRPPGITGAAVEGFFRVVSPPYPIHVFEERGEALSWLGCQKHVASLAQIEESSLDTSSSASFLTDLRRVLGKQLLEITPATAAKSLGLSVRSLQRRLRAEGTSFQRELSLMRVRVAQSKMLETDMPLATIALEVGYSSAAAFSLVFRRLEGMSPSEWRDAQPS